jgi:3,4-dihydroxy 2-butanone 4-phosphate synthase/GTP cyclohydrolase II
VGAQILVNLGVRRMRLLTNNPAKRAGLEGYDLTIADLIKYRLRTEHLVYRHAEADLPTAFGSFRAVVFKNEIDHVDHIAFVKGEVRPDEPALVRMHSECLTGDALGSLRCDCGEQLHAALSMIEEAGSGVLVYMRQEGRGIGLANKIKAYALQDEEGLDTGDFGVGAQILVNLGVRRMRLLTNNPAKRAGLEGYDLTIVDRVPIEMPPNEKNANYLRTKREKLGHLLSLMS